MTASSIWWSHLVSDFSDIPTSALPAGIAKGVRFTSMTIDVPRYLRYLLSQHAAAGGRLIRTHLPTEHGFAHALRVAVDVARSNGLSEVAAFVNATGLGARALVGDHEVFPTRGQTVLVKGEARAISTVEAKGGIKYVLPRAGAGLTVLGGTKEAGNWNTSPQEPTTRDILEGCKSLAPELLNAHGEFDILAVQVGLRPSRNGGPRVEVEIVEGGYKVVHSYGHGGAGYQNSIGNARKVVELINGILNRIPVG